MTNHAGRPEQLRDRAKVAIGLLGLVAVVDLYALSKDISFAATIGDAMAGSISGRELIAAEDSFNQAALVQIGAVLVCSIGFLLWFVRAYANSAAMGAEPRHSRGWAIGGWFVPIIALIYPKQITDDIYRGSDPEGSYPPESGWREASVSPLVHWWWAAFLLGGLLGNRVVNAAFPADTLAGYQSQIQAYMYVDLLNVVGVVLAALVVRKITDRLEARREMFESGQLALSTEIQEATPAPPPPPPGFEAPGAPSPAYAISTPTPATVPDGASSPPPGPPIGPGMMAAQAPAPTAAPAGLSRQEQVLRGMTPPPPFGDG